ncbi:MAG: phage antirepressor N-terminal domain-containing protein, partial [Alphaproteobacteria bacterium]|nr:phage antirepressor N-terminal domain-containing protein [Alphaproteobacteria bacterium]
VPMKPICENIGLAWQPQHRKLTNGDRSWGVTFMVIPSVGGEQETLCLPLRMIPAWLFLLAPTRVKPELRDKLVAYQQECADVLWRHFTGQITGREQAIRSELVERDELITTIERQHRHMASYLLAANPLWGKIAHMLNAGCYRGDICHVLNRPKWQIARVIEEMERVGVIQREDWRPSMWGIHDGPSPSALAEQEAAHG